MTLRIGWLALVVPLLSGCAAVFPGHIDSEFTANEVVRLEFVKTPEPREGMEALPLAAAAGPIIDLAIDAIGAGLEKEAKRFEASYSARASETFYWKANSLAHQYDRFLVTREAAAKTRGPLRSLYPLLRGRQGDAAPASQFVFKFEPSPTGDTFRILMTEAYVSRSKAKVLHPNWKEYWWTRVPLVYGFFYDLSNVLGFLDWGDGSLDIDISAQMDAVWVDGNKGQRASLGTLNAKLRDVELGGPCGIQGSAGASACKNHVTTPISTGWIPAPPRSTGLDKEPFGRGSFDLTVKVSEFDDFKESVVKGAELLKEKKGDLSSQLLESLQLGE